VSFDIFLQCFRNQELAGFDRAVFDEIFGPYIVERDETFVRLCYPDRGCADIYVRDTPTIDSMMINHFGGEMFFEGLYELAQRTGSLIHWPSEEDASVVTDRETWTHIPTVFTNEDAHPTLASNWRQMVDAIERSN